MRVDRRRIDANEGSVTSYEPEDPGGQGMRQRGEKMRGKEYKGIHTPFFGLIHGLSLKGRGYQ